MRPESFLLQGCLCCVIILEYVLSLLVHSFKMLYTGYNGKYLKYFSISNKSLFIYLFTKTYVIFIFIILMPTLSPVSRCGVTWDLSGRPVACYLPTDHKERPMRLKRDISCLQHRPTMDVIYCNICILIKNILGIVPILQALYRV